MLRGKSTSAGALEVDGPGASAIVDHPFVPRDQWWSVCGHEYGRRLPFKDNRHSCGLAEAAHASTTLTCDPSVCALCGQGEGHSKRCSVTRDDVDESKFRMPARHEETDA